MSPNGGVDIDVVVNPASALKVFKDLTKAGEEMGKGVEGGVERWNQALDKFGVLATKVIDRTRQAQERYVRSLEQTAAAAGKTGVEKLMAQRDAMIKKLGDEEKLIDRVRAAYQKLIDTERNRGSGGDSGTLALRGIRDLFEGRTAYGEVQIGKALGGLSGLPLVLGGIGAAFIGMTAAGYEAAKSIGEYGQRVHDAQIVTGLTAKEVQQFSYAAKVTGQDVSTLDRMMRGLTQAVEDTGAHGQRARQTLSGMGVDLLSLRSGATSSVDLFKQISASLEAQPNLWLRNRDAIDLFKRAGITSLPMLIELNNSLKASEGINFVGEKQIEQFRQMNQQMVKLETEWDQFLVQIKSSLAKPFILTLQLALAGAQAGVSPLMGNKQGAIDMGGASDERLAEALRGGLLSSLAGTQSRDLISQRSGRPQMEMKSRSDYLYGLRGSDPEAASAEASRLKRIYDETRDDVTKTKDEIVKARVEYEKQEAVAKALAKLEADRLANAEALRKAQSEAAVRAAHPYGMLPSERSMMEFAARSNVTGGQISAFNAATRPELDSEVDAILRRSGLRRGPGGTIVRDAKQIAATAGGFISPSGDLSAHYQAQIAAGGRLMEETNRQATTNDTELIRRGEAILRSNRQLGVETGVGTARISGTLSMQTPENRLAMEAQIARIRITASNEEYNNERAKIADLYGDKTNREMAYEELRIKRAQEVGEIEMKYAEEVASEQRKRLDEIKGPTQSLLHTLFTNPRSFPHALGTTVRDAALRPVEGLLSEGIARSLYGTIFGGGGGGGGRGPVGTIGDPVAVQVVGMGVGGGGGGSVGGGGGWGFGGDVGGALGGILGGSGGGSTGGGGGGGGGGGIGGFLGRIFGGGGGIGSGLKGLGGGLLGGLKSAAGFGDIQNGWAINGNTAYNINTLSGKLGAFANSPLAKAGSFAAGMALASNGLMGNNRGTVGGMFEGMAGGAGIGFAVGGPLGAAIGAAAGLAIGGAEMLFGVKSLRNHAKDLVRQQYGISINNAMADQIVSLSKQSYGGQVSIAVRSPEVRQMLGLYAAGTGQASQFPQSSMTPHGASLVESGGQLQQNPVYQYGNAYSYQSNLPVYGGGSTGSLPYGGSQIALSISGSDAAKFFTGQVVTPEYVGSSYSAALNASAGRTQQAMTLSEPGTIVS